MRRFPDFAALNPGCKLSTPRKFMCIGMPQQNARRLLRFVRAQRQKCAALSTAINIRAQLSLDATHFDATFAPSRSRQGAFARHCDGRTGCGVLRVCSMQADSREASGNTALPPLRAERANAPMRDPRAPLMCNARTVRQGGSEPTIAAVERREASIPAGMQGVS